MKKGFTIVEVIFFLIIVISFSLIIFEREIDILLATENTQELNTTK
jgi:competence protein ComGC